MPRSLTAVQYLAPYSCDFKSTKAHTDNSGLTWTRCGIELRNCSRFLRWWCTVRRYIKSGQSQLAQSDGCSSLVHLVRNTFGMLFVLSVFSHVLVFAFDLDSKEARRRGLFGHWHRLIWCHSNPCMNSLSQLEQSQHYLLIIDFQIQNLGHENTIPDGKGWVSTIHHWGSITHSLSDGRSNGLHLIFQPFQLFQSNIQFCHYY